MIRNKTFLTVAIITFATFFVVGHVFAESASEIKARIKARMPQVSQLKTSGTVGESADGLLSFVKGASAGADIVNAENSDRKKIYVAIAKQQGTTPDVVGQRRALQISQKAKPGTWIQDSSGAWAQK